MTKKRKQPTSRKAKAVFDKMTVVYTPTRCDGITAGELIAILQKVPPDTPMTMRGQWLASRGGLQEAAMKVNAQAKGVIGTGMVCGAEEVSILKDFVRRSADGKRKSVV